MTGTLDTLQTGATSVTTNTITGFLTAEVTLTNGLLTSYSATFNASNGMALSLDTGYYGGGHIDNFYPGPRVEQHHGEQHHANCGWF